MLTGLHTNWLSNSYQDDRDYLLKVPENNELRQGLNLTANLRPKFDGSNSLAIGYGLDLLVNSDTTIDSYLTSAGLPVLTSADKQLLAQARTTRKAGIAAGVDLSASLSGVASQLSLAFPSEQKASEVLRVIVNVKENGLVDDLMSAGMSSADIVALKNTCEFAVLVSLKYNGALGPKLINAIKNGDRAEAWYEIRYNSSKSGGINVGGLVKRRYFEAEYFGPYSSSVDANNVATMTDENAKSMFRAYSRHKQSMDEYETKWSSYVAKAVTDYGAPNAGSGNSFDVKFVHTLSADLAPARTYLIEKYVVQPATGISITGNILVGENNGQEPGSTNTMYFRGTDSDVLKGGTSNDLIFGESGTDFLYGEGGNDVIYGGAGNDFITGGEGDDYMEGGTGNDTYYINAGDGHDTIKDVDGGRIIYKDAQGVYHSLFGGLQLAEGSGIYAPLSDNQARYRMDGSDLIITLDGNDAITVKDANLPSFNMVLTDLTNAMAPNHDGGPVDPLYAQGSNASAPLLNAGPALVGTGNHDFFSVGNTTQRIDGLSGDDLLEGRAGVQGYVSGIEINGGAGADTLYAENYETLLLPDQLSVALPYLDQYSPILAGYLRSGVSVAGINDWMWYNNLGGAEGFQAVFGVTPTGAGAHLDGGTEEDSLYGSLLDDTLVGGAGSDFVAGEAGNDILIGDDESLSTAERGADILSGGDGDDRLYAAARSDYDTILDSHAATSERNWLDGGNGNDLLVGSTGTDVLVGGAGNDTVFGGAGNDYLLGDTDWAPQSFDWTVTVTPSNENGRSFSPVVNASTHPAAAGDDVLYGGDGNDWIVGEGGSDFLFGGADADFLDGDSGAIDPAKMGDDYLDGGDGKDVLIGNGGADSLYGGAGDDRLTGDAVGLDARYQGDDCLNGGAGNDELYGNGGDDIFVGGTNNDLLLGGLGNDTYLFKIGDGQDLVLDDGGIDAISFDEGISPSSVGAAIFRGDLLLAFGNGDQITVSNWTDPASRVERIEFADGTVWNEDDIMRATGTLVLDADVSGNNATDSLGANTHYAITNSSSGAFSLGSVSSAAGKIYVPTVVEINNWTGTDGKSGADISLDYIDEDGVSATDPSNTGASYDGSIYKNVGLPSNGLGGSFGIKFSHYSLVTNAYATSHTGSYIQNSFSSSLYLNFGNSPFNVYAVSNVIYTGTNGDDDMNPFNFSDNGYTSFYYDGEGNDVMHGSGGRDVFVTGGGNDTMYGGKGSDFYYIHPTASDVILDNNGGQTYTFSPDTIRVMDGVQLADLTFSRDGDDLLIDNTRVLRFFEVGSTSNPSAQYRYIIERLEGDGWSVDLPEHLIGLGLFGAATGTAGDDIINGSLLDNLIYGLAGDDVINGLSGNDALYGGDGRDTLIGDNGDDLLDGGAGDDTLDGGNGADILNGGAGGDYLVGGEGQDLLDGGTGNNYLDGGDDGDTYQIYQGGGLSTLQDNGVNRFETQLGQLDTQLAGLDSYSDSIYADSSWAYYLIEIHPVPGEYPSELIDAVTALSDGVSPEQARVTLNEIKSFLAAYEADVVQFGAGITPSNVQVHWSNGRTYVDEYGDTQSAPGQLWTDLGNNEGLFSVDNQGGHNFGIETFRFGDGTELSADQFLALDSNPGHVGIQAGTVGADTLTGSGFYDTLYGYDGNDLLVGGGQGDVLHAGAGDDLLVGGTGTDDLYGGAGSDTYLFNPGDVNAGLVVVEGDPNMDRIYESAKVAGSTDINTISFGGGITSSQILAQLQVNQYEDGTGDVELVLKISSTGEEINIQWSSTYFDADGNLVTDNTIVEHAQFLGAVTHQVFDLEGLVNARWSELQAAYDSDPTSFVSLITPSVQNLYDITNTTGISGGQRAVNYAATNDVFTALPGLTPPPSNTSPTVINPINDQATAEDQSFTFQVPVNTFADADSGDSLTYSATLADGSALPAWLGFDVATGTFSGTPTNAEVGTLNLRVTATDTSGASVSDVFVVSVTNVNDAPSVSNVIADQSATQDQPFTFVVPVGTFTDADAPYGDVLTYSASLADGSALPAWLTFNAATQTFVGTPANENVGGLSLRVTATDASGVAVSNTFALSVVNVNDAPMVVLPITDQAAEEGYLFTYQMPTGTFADVDAAYGDTLTYQATQANGAALPAWLTFNAQTRTFTGTPVSGSKGALQIILTAVDSGGLQVASSFVLNIDLHKVIGTAGNDTLTGSTGNDLLDGGAGADTMSGGAGNDTYLVDNAGDVVTELANGGNDTVESSITYTLAANVENLVLTGSNAINGTGNNLANNIVGNSADNVLSGGTANDTLRGNDGNDTLNASAGNDRLEGGVGNDTLNGGTGADTMIGGIGDDTYIVDDVGDLVSENSGEGVDTVKNSISYTLTANVENLTLTGTASINGTGNELDNAIIGNSGNNVLIGDAGNDSLDGKAGADTMLGGVGNDSYVVDNTGDLVLENVGEGIDTVKSSITYTLTGNVENLTLTGSVAINGTGNELDNSLTGNSATNILTGGAGNDHLDGLGGNDTLAGGIGDDTYVVSVVGDIVTENLDEGIDTVASSITYVLGNNVENVSLTGSGNINATGNAQDNVLTGNGGNNVLNGGAGVDTMIGGAGNDTYVVDDIGDAVVEQANDGTDTVQSGITYSLGINVENLTLTGAAALNGTGNGLVNTITGNSGNNVLDGGIGADTLKGGLGDDTYIVDNTGDVVTESSAQGTDTVLSSVSYTLSNNVENLNLTGASTIDGTGNSIANVLTGNNADNMLDGSGGNDILYGMAGNDTLLGGAGNDTIEGGIGNDILDGGTGNDTMTGGAGDDTYIVNATADIVIESADEGTDSVSSSVTYTLGGNVENLSLTGATNLNGTGNTLDNILTGNTANNTLTGNAGNDTLDGKAGTDTLIGGTGNDTYIFNRGYGTDTLQENDTTAGNLDTIALAAGITTTDVVLSRSANNLVLTLGTDTLTVNNFYTAAANEIERITFADGTIWNSATIMSNAAAVQSVQSLSVQSIDTVSAPAPVSSDTGRMYAGGSPLFSETGGSLTPLTGAVTPTVAALTPLVPNSDKVYTGGSPSFNEAGAITSQVANLVQAMATFNADRGVASDPLTVPGPEEVQPLLVAYS